MRISRCVTYRRPKDRSARFAAVARSTKGAYGGGYEIFSHHLDLFLQLIPTSKHQTNESHQPCLVPVNDVKGLERCLRARN